MKIGAVAAAVVAALAVGWLAPIAGAQDLRLIEAIRGDSGDSVAALIAAGIDVDARQPDGATALHWAAGRDDLASAKRLLAAGADPDAANDYGVTPLFLAATNGSAAMIERLLAAGATAGAALPTG